MAKKNVYECEIVRKNGVCHPFLENISPELCRPEELMAPIYKDPGTIEVISSEDEHHEDGRVMDEALTSKSGPLWNCPTTWCTAQFILLRNLEAHVQRGNHRMRVRDKALTDHLKILWFDKFGLEASQTLPNQEKSKYFQTHLQELPEIVLPDSNPSQESEIQDDDEIMGFAMATRQKNPKIVQKIHDFVQQIYDRGQRTNNKKTFGEIVREIQSNFERDVWIKESQVKYLVTKFKVDNLKKSKEATNPALDPEELRAEAKDEISQELLHQAMNRAVDVLNGKQTWTTSHPIQVIFFASIFKYIFVKIDTVKYS